MKSATARPPLPRILAAGTLLLAAALAGTPSAGAEEPVDGSRLVLRTERVLVFKDGHALFVKTAVGTADAAGCVFTEETPARVVLGGLWAASDDGAPLTLRSRRREWTERRTRTVPCVTPADVLEANGGREVALMVDGGAAEGETGTVLRVLRPPAPAEIPLPRFSPRGEPVLPTEAEANEPREVLVHTAAGGSVVLRQGNGRERVLPLSLVRFVTGRDLVYEREEAVEVRSGARRLVADLGPAAAGKPVRLRILYFAEGVRWIPAWRITGDLASEATATLQGEVLNDAEDIVDAELGLVVGVPHFLFADTASPLGLESVMRNALAGVAPALASQMAFSNFVARAPEPEAGPAALRDPEDAGAGDLFVLPAGRTSLLRGERAAFPLGTFVAPVEHVYTLDLAVLRDPQSGGHSYHSGREGPPPSGPRREENRSPVWHELELRNLSRTPWTTGAALLLRDGLPLGQDLLPYTAPGGRARVPVTVAVDVQSRYTEEELLRKADVLKWSHSLYSLVRKRGTVRVVNRRGAATPLRVAIGVGGRAENPSDDGTVVVNDLRSSDWGGNALPVNNHSDLSWELTLAPGETRELTFEFEFHVR